MARIWLPRHTVLVSQKVRDEKTGREMILFLPTPEMTESRSHEQELIEAATESAIEKMRAKGPITTVSRQEVSEALRDFRKRLEKAKSRSSPSRYVGGF